MPLPWVWDLAEYCGDTGLTFAPAVTHRFTLDQTEEALRTADEARAGKVLFVAD